MRRKLAKHNGDIETRERNKDRKKKKMKMKKEKGNYCKDGKTEASRGEKNAPTPSDENDKTKVAFFRAKHSRKCVFSIAFAFATDSGYSIFDLPINFNDNIFELIRFCILQFS